MEVQLGMLMDVLRVQQLAATLQQQLQQND
jgi:hypothetical protein